MKQIVVELLSKKYGSFEAVKDISFEVDKGEIVGFLGPNGAGKTTTMKILTSYMPATSGEAYIAGKNVYEDSEQTKKLVGYLPENNPLIPEMTVREYLEFIGKIRELPDELLKARMVYVIEKCGISSIYNRSISELSKGFRQRVGLAQAILHNPDILILDEPTSGLDPNQIVEIRKLIKELGREKTVILSTHILQEVQAVCGRVIIINNGRIVADSPKEELQYLGGNEVTLFLEVKGYNPAFLDEVSKLHDVRRAMLISEEGDSARIELNYAKDIDLREEIFDLAVKYGQKILEQYRKMISLEDIFRKLTGGDNSSEEQGNA